jgi:DNA mismatch repair protein MSH6
MLHMLSL